MARNNEITSVQGVKHCKSRATKYTKSIAGLAGFGLKVTPAGGKFYTFTGRRLGERHTTQWTLGSVDDLDFEIARSKAKEARLAVLEGREPGEPVKARDGARPTFGQAAEAWLTKRRKDLRQFKSIENHVRHARAAWEHKPLAEVTRADLVALLDGFASKSFQRNIFTTLRAMFNQWVQWGVLPLDHTSPCRAFDAKSAFGKRVARKRQLEDSEIVRLWQESVKLGFPFGDLFRTLLLTGARRSEWADAQFEEIRGDMLIVPANRFKSGKEDTDRDGRIAINSEVRKILDAVPHRSGFIFSFNGGLTAISKSKVDKAKATIRDLGIGSQWQWHDLRRNITTGLRKAKFDKVVREVVLNHTLTGLDAHYEGSEKADAFDGEMLEASEAWAQHVLALVNPTPAGAINFQAAKRKRRA